MLKYGGDALLLLFVDEGHAARAVAACHDMQARLREVGRVETGAGPVRLRMSVGAHSGTFDMFRVGTGHTELVVAGPGATATCAMEAAADAGEILVSSSTADHLAPVVLGAPKAGGRLLRRRPDAPFVATEPVPAQAGVDRFLSPAVASYVAQGAVDPDHRLATIAFLHLIGVDDRLAAGEPAAVVADALHETLSTIQEALTDLGVTFLATDVIANGTKVMASAGAPIAVEAAGERMVRALLRIRDAATPLPVRAGAHQGHVFAGDVGPSFRRTFTTIGDVTNTAARVMGQAKPGEVLALGSVLDHVPSCVSEPQPSFVAKGKAEPLVPHLVRHVERRAVDVEAVDAASLPFVGRAVELDELARAAARAVSGTGGAVEVVGDPGIGKTRLVQELSAPAMRRVTVRCEPYERQTSYFAVRFLLHPAVGSVDSADELRLRLRHVAPDLDRWFPLLADVFDLEADQTPETAPLEGAFRRQRTSLLVEEVLERVVDEPMLLVVEDVHWLDEASGDVLRHLEQVGARHPWFLVSTRREEPSTFAPQRTIALGPLGEDDVLAAIRSVLAAAPLPPVRERALVERSGGNPLFLEGLLRDDADGDLPESVEALVAARVDRLGHDQRRALRSAAVLGASFDPALLQAIDPTVVPGSIADLLEAEGGGRLRFRHQLVRDVAYEALPYRERRRLHRLAGEHLESARSQDGSLELLSLHFFRAEEYRKAWRYSHRAGRSAARKHAHADAVVLYQRAMAAASFVPWVAPRVLGRAWEDLGDSANTASMRDEARRAFRRARKLLRDVDPVAYAWLCCKEAKLAEWAGSRDAALRWLRHGIASLEGQSSPKAVAVRADLWAAQAWMSRQAGRPEHAVRLAERAIHEGRGVRHELGRRAVANAYVILDGAEIALGRPSRATHATKALKIFERLGALADQAIVLNNLGAHAYHCGRWDEALDLFDRSRSSNARIGNHLDAGYGSWNIAEILMDQGRIEEAERELASLSLLWRSVGFALGDALVDWQRGRLEGRWGDPARGLELLRPVRERLDALGLAPTSSASTPPSPSACSGPPPWSRRRPSWRRRSPPTVRPAGRRACRRCTGCGATARPRTVESRTRGRPSTRACTKPAPGRRPTTSRWRWRGSPCWGRSVLGSTSSVTASASSCCATSASWRHHLRRSGRPSPRPATFISSAPPPERATAADTRSAAAAGAAIRWERRSPSADPHLPRTLSGGNSSGSFDSMLTSNHTRFAPAGPVRVGIPSRHGDGTAWPATSHGGISTSVVAAADFSKYRR